MNAFEKILSSLRYPRLAMARLARRLNFDELMAMQTLAEGGLLKSIRTVVDAGAHHGAYARVFSYSMPNASVYCFEPVPETFAALSQNIRDCPRIKAFELALGSTTKKFTMNVSSLDVASSLLPMNDTHKEMWPESRGGRQIEVKVKTLDDFDHEHNLEGDIFIKADVQGFELDLLRGASNVLKKTKLIRLELSYVELYQGAPKFSEVCSFLEATGFRFHSLANDVTTTKDQLPLQGDFVFVRTGDR
jgi:FkbM family methyltransferase